MCISVRVVIVPRRVLHVRRNPDRLVDFLQLALFDQFLLHAHGGIFRLGRTAEVFYIEPRCRDYLAQAAVALITLTESFFIHSMPRLKNDVARITCIFIGRHSRSRQKKVCQEWQTRFRQCTQYQARASERSATLACIASCLLIFQIRAAFSPSTLRLISGVSLGYPYPSTSSSGIWNLRNASICH